MKLLLRDAVTVSDKNKKLLENLILASLVICAHSNAWAAPVCSADDKPEISSFVALDPNHKLRDETKENLCNRPITDQIGFLSYTIKSSHGGSDIERVVIKHVGKFNDGPDNIERLIYSWPGNTDLRVLPMVFDDNISDPGPITRQNRSGYYKITATNTCGVSSEEFVEYTHWLPPRIGVIGPLKENSSGNDWSYTAVLDYATENVDQLKMVWGNVSFPRSTLPDRIIDDMISMAAPIIPHGEKIIGLDPLSPSGYKTFRLNNPESDEWWNDEGEGGERGSNMLDRNYYRVNLKASYSTPHGPISTSCEMDYANKQVLIARFDDCFRRPEFQRNCNWEAEERIFRH